MNKIIYQDMERICKEHIDCFSQLKDKSILLIGSTGTILSYMAEFLVALNFKYNLGIKIYLHGRNRVKLEQRHKKILNEKDVFLMEFDLLKGIPDNIHFDYIVHGASPAATNFFLNAPVDTILPNVYGMNNVLDYAKNEIGGVKALFLSSNAIYGRVDKKVITEDIYGLIDPLADRSCYVEAKRLTEQLCVAYAKQYKVKSYIARVPFTYAPNYDLENDKRAIPRFIKKIIEDKDIEMFQDDTPIQYTYVADVISGFLYILLKGETLPIGVYNVCSSNCMDMKNIVDIMIKSSNSKSKIILKDEDYYFKNNKELDFTFVDNKKLKSLGWTEQFDFSSGLKQTILGIYDRYKIK